MLEVEEHSALLLLNVWLDLLTLVKHELGDSRAILEVDHAEGSLPQLIKSYSLDSSTLFLGQAHAIEVCCTFLDEQEVRCLDFFHPLYFLVSGLYSFVV